MKQLDRPDGKSSCVGMAERRFRRCTSLYRFAQYLNCQLVQVANFEDVSSICRTNRSIEGMFLPESTEEKGSEA